MTRPAKTIRDKNFNYNEAEEAKERQVVNHKETKLNQIHEYRRAAILGNKSERAMISKQFMEQAKQLDTVKKNHDLKLKEVDRQHFLKTQAVFMQDCARRD